MACLSSAPAEGSARWLGSAPAAAGNRCRLRRRGHARWCAAGDTAAAALCSPALARCVASIIHWNGANVNLQWVALCQYYNAEWKGRVGPVRIRTHFLVVA